MAAIVTVQQTSHRTRRGSASLAALHQTATSLGALVGFSYRKSFKAGPFRATVSKSGVSYSAGVKGARVTKRADGRVKTTLSAPGTGLRHTTTSGARSSRPGQASAAGVSQGVSLVPPAQPLRLKGMRSWITLHPDRIEIKRSRLPGGSHLNLPWSEVIDIEAVRPTILGEARPMFDEQARRGLIHPLAVEWVGAQDLTVNPRTGKLVRLIDERMD
ncbi:DUF4236 domain-containing protein [Streptacidiphilus pinicola]|uniref:DUF4236 domain-containing protein n=1 Tax=Streptacidiphilus pinicola TaxID=2219663 RepID=UPI001A9FBA97|nr:DUF4236 domain-containing protein [Streptacidiphilus pinicola]